MRALADFNFNWVSDTPEYDELAKILLLYYYYRQVRRYEKQKKLLYKSHTAVCRVYIFIIYIYILLGVL